MITKAEIKAKNGNKFTVRVPLFESAGNVKEAILTATLCYAPGNLESYQPGDIVFVDFENNQISNPVIIGKLYRGDEKETIGKTFNASLETTNSAKLPRDTSIGDLSSDEVNTALRNSLHFEEQIQQLNDNLKRIAEYVDTLTAVSKYVYAKVTPDQEEATGVYTTPYGKQFEITGTFISRLTDEIRNLYTGIEYEGENDSIPSDVISEYNIVDENIATRSDISKKLKK